MAWSKAEQASERRCSSSEDAWSGASRRWKLRKAWVSQSFDEQNVCIQQIQQIANYKLYMGAKESSTSSLKDQAWCSTSPSFCKSCVTEVENVNTEIKRATPPIPKQEMHQILMEQQRKGKQINQNGLKFRAVHQMDPTRGSPIDLSQHPLHNESYLQNASSMLGGPDVGGGYNSGGYTSLDQPQRMITNLGANNLHVIRADERVARVQELVNYAPKLQLRVLSSAYLEKGDTLMINTLGLEDGVSLRKANDGFTYFGCKKSIKKLVTTRFGGAGPSKVHFKSVNQEGGDHQLTVGSKGGMNSAATHMGATGASQEEEVFEKEIINDFVIPTKNEEEKEKHRGRQFQIHFDPETMAYKIKDLGIGFGAFVKLNSPLVLRDNFLLNMGESYIVANLLRGQEDGIQNLRLKIFSVVKADQPDIFCFNNNPEEEPQEIIIGRTPNCHIRIEDKLLSKMQATIRNDQGGEWVLYDGYQGRESTNGTWLYLNEDCVIEDGMIFKSNQTFFEATLLPQQQPAPTFGGGR